MGLRRVLPAGLRRPADGVRRDGAVRRDVESKWLFQFAFCAVSLAIVWGTTLERIKFGAYVIYAIVFAAVIYPIGAHWVFGGGWLQSGGLPDTAGMQDFAGSTAVHLIGATGALAALLLLGARKGKFGSDGKPRADPGALDAPLRPRHPDPVLGWFGFNPGSTLGAADVRFAEVAMVTLLGAAGGVIGAFDDHAADPADDRHRHGRQRHDRRPGRDHGALGLRRGVGRSDHRPGGRRDRRGGRHPIERSSTTRSGALWAHGLAGIWGTLACGIFTAPRLAQYNAFGDPEGGLFYSGTFTQLGHQAIGMVIAFTLRVRAELRDVLGDQEDDRAPRHGGPGGSRPRHRRARHVRIPRAVHPAA